MYKSPKLDEEVRLLGRLLGEVIREQEGSAFFAVEEEIRHGARARRRGEPGAEDALLGRIASLSEPEARAVTRAFAIFFELANLSEDRERIRVLRARERGHGLLPRPESIADAIRTARERGVPASHIKNLLGRMFIELVFTAHPTEAKRRSVRAAVRLMRSSLKALDDPALLDRERGKLLTGLRTALTVLWQTELMRPRRPSVLDEVEVGLYFLTTLWDVVPAVYRDLESALETFYPEERFTLPAFLRFGSWIGGDRDGNPNVDRDVTERTLLRMHAAAAELHLRECRRLFEELSVSSREAPVSPALEKAIERELAAFPDARPALEGVSPHEAYRRHLAVMAWRLERTAREDSVLRRVPGSYADGSELLADLLLMRDSLNAHKGGRISEGLLSDWIWRARVFGLQMARLDIRQESSMNARAMAAILKTLGLAPDWGAMTEEEKTGLLAATMGGTRAGSSAAAAPIPDAGSEAAETIHLFRLLSAASTRFTPGGYVISMTHALSDVLSVLWLCRNPALTAAAGDGGLSMDIIPLFETIDDLAASAGILGRMLESPPYREHLRRRGDLQIVMIGYSDSTKDGGYLAASWAQYRAQSEMHRAAAPHGVRLVFFHGRGGALGRGGGPAARSIQSLPPETLDDGLRVTEQGEVLADRYDDPLIAHRHLEQVTWAMLESSFTPLSPPRPAWQEAMEELADRAQEAYRSLVAEPGFMEYFESSTPIREIESLPIASRPSRRHGRRTLADLRAIPWVFSWTQSRCLIPAWYGLGEAMAAYTGRHHDGAAVLKEMYEGWGFFRATVDNAALALAKADMPIAGMYASLTEDRDTRERIWRLIREEHDRSRSAVLSITGREELLSEIPWLRQSIDVRNPNTDPLSMVQVEWMRRLRARETAGDEAGMEECRQLLRLTVEGVASGMRTTG